MVIVCLVVSWLLLLNLTDYLNIVMSLLHHCNRNIQMVVYQVPKDFWINNILLPTECF